MVGIGTSAGGLAALQVFFSAVVPDAASPLAFIVVQHLAPDHKSLLADLIRRHTSMPVFEVEDGMTVQPRCTYVIPPGRDLSLQGGVLHLHMPAEPHGHRLPIDSFFRSLALDQHARAIGIVLSGMGADGTLGARAIKDAGGMVMVQDASTAEFDAMPLSALAADVVDFELPPAEMPARIMAHLEHGLDVPPQFGARMKGVGEDVIGQIFMLLRTRTGHDFSQYKPSTIERRIERRLAAHQIVSASAYVTLLSQSPTEVTALFQDLLIGVTSFFRDTEPFTTLERAGIPTLFAKKPSGGVIRIWVVACSTGEEAYSIAILLFEHMEALKRNYVIQVFATDLDSRAIATARAGFYSPSIATDISAERLARFFTAEPDGSGYRIQRSIRDMLVFSEHDVLRDPPFSRLDLISCRNLLIYLGADPQKRLIPLFHFALNAHGLLFLGTSEGIGDCVDLFGPVDRTSKLYLRKDDAHAAQRAALDRVLPKMSATYGQPPRATALPPMAEKTSLRSLTEQALLEERAPAGALVNAAGDVLYIHGRTGMFLEPAPGEPGVGNIVTMAREGLRGAIASALRTARTDGAARTNGVHVKHGGQVTVVDLSVHAVPAGSGTPSESTFYLVILLESRSEAMPPHDAAPDSLNAEVDARIIALQKDLQSKDEYLRSTHEALEHSNEELSSSNEEMQSVNEELQSTNEELETSKEELQSVNEELSTVNHELQAKVTDLSRLNDDMRNLLAGTGIATVFLDLKLRILRFTPTASQLINLIAADVGRPVAHLASNLLGYDDLVADACEVLDDLKPKERQVQSTSGAWFMLRICPYRTDENVVGGVVITFTDITALKAAQDKLASANQVLLLAAVARDAEDAMVVHDLDGHILAWNPGATRLYGWTEAEALQMNVRERIPEALRVQALSKARELSRAEVLAPYRTDRLNKAGGIVPIWMTATALVNEAGQMYAITTTERRNPPGSQGPGSPLPTGTP